LLTYLLLAGAKLQQALDFGVKDG
jgi:hypothetical protein